MYIGWVVIFWSFISFVIFNSCSLISGGCVLPYPKDKNPFWSCIVEVLHLWHDKSNMVTWMFIGQVCAGLAPLALTRAHPPCNQGQFHKNIEDLFWNAGSSFYSSKKHCLNIECKKTVAYHHRYNSVAPFSHVCVCVTIYLIYILRYSCVFIESFLDL